MSTWLTLDTYRTIMREAIASDLDPVLQLHLDSAEGEVESFIGFDPSVEFESVANIPSELKTAGYILAQINTDQLTADEANHRRAGAHSLMRPYRTDTGIAA